MTKRRVFRTKPRHAAASAWVETAVGVGLSLRLTSGTNNWFLHHVLIELAAAQYSAELAFSRLRRSARVAAAPDANLNHHCRMRHEVHAFLVAAHRYWELLRGLAPHTTYPPFRLALRQNRQNIRDTRIARDHVEHLPERLAHGRKGAYGSEIGAEPFWRQPGLSDGASVTFGGETFDLARIHAAIRQLGLELAPALAEAAQPQLRIALKPP